jgi:hypothetical protein
MDPNEMACGDEHCLDEVDQNGFSDELLLNMKTDFLSYYVKISVYTLQHAVRASLQLGAKLIG